MKEDDAKEWQERNKMEKEEKWRIITQYFNNFEIFLCQENDKGYIKKKRN